MPLPSRTVYAEEQCNSQDPSVVPVAIATPLRERYGVYPSPLVSSFEVPQYTVRGESSVGSRLNNHLQLSNSTVTVFSGATNNDHIPTLTRWRDGLFSCCNQLYPSCFCAFFCPCALVGDITAKTNHIPFFFSFAIFVTLYVISIFLLATKGGLIGAAICWGFLSLFVCTIRKRIRTHNRFHLGNDSEDCATSCCCVHCVIAQMARHVFQYSSLVECASGEHSYCCFKSASNNHHSTSNGRQSTRSRTCRIPGQLSMASHLSPFSSLSPPPRVAARENVLHSATVAEVSAPAIAQVTVVELSNCGEGVEQHPLASSAVMV